jgi:hypothetical protein
MIEGEIPSTAVMGDGLKGWNNQTYLPKGNIEDGCYVISIIIY